MPPPELEPVEFTPDQVKEACAQAKDALDQAMGAVALSIEKILRAGALLRRQQELVPEGEWMGWIEANLSVCYRTVRNWIKLAYFADRKSVDLENAQTVRQAYVLAGLLPEPGSATAGSPPPGAYLIQVARVQRSIEAEIAAKPLKDWAPAEKQILRDRLEPFVRIFHQLTEEEPAQ